MKYVILVLVVVVVAWLMLRSRRPRPPATHRAPRGVAARPMLQCSHCGLHLPHGDALHDARGVFCSEAHRLAGPRPP
jgi:uncharacterized protein